MTICHFIRFSQPENLRNIKVYKVRNIPMVRSVSLIGFLIYDRIANILVFTWRTGNFIYRQPFFMECIQLGSFRDFTSYGFVPNFSDNCSYRTRDFSLRGLTVIICHFLSLSNNPPIIKYAGMSV